MGKEFCRNASRLIMVLFLIQLPLATICVHNSSALQCDSSETLLVSIAAELFLLSNLKYQRAKVTRHLKRYLK